MNTIEIIVYGSPRIHVLKRHGYMNEKGKSKYISLWPDASVWYGHSCVRVKSDLTSYPDKSKFIQYVRSAVSIGQLSKLSAVKITVDNLLVTSYRSINDFYTNMDPKWESFTSKLNFNG